APRAHPCNSRLNPTVPTRSQTCRQHAETALDLDGGLSAVDDRGPIEALRHPLRRAAEHSRFPRSMTAAPLKRRVFRCVDGLQRGLSAVDDRGPIEAPGTALPSIVIA